MPNEALSEGGSPGLEGYTTHMYAKYLPEYDGLCLRYWNDQKSLPWKLWTIAEKSAVSSPLVGVMPYHPLIEKQNLSGRTLCRLPVLALAMHIKRDPCTIDEALVALSKAVEEEKMTEVNGH